VWVVGRVAAVGRAETLQGRPLRAAYFLAATDFGSYPDENLPANLRAAMRVQGKQPLTP
jgi:hypothetical protein